MKRLLLLRPLLLRPLLPRVAVLSAPSFAVPLAVLLAVSAVHAQSDQMYTASPQQLAAVKVVLAQQAAWNRGDLAGFLSHYKDDPTTEAMLGSAARGPDEIRTAFHTNFPNVPSMGHIEYTEFDAHTLGPGYTLVVAHYHLERAKKAGGDAEGTLTEIVERVAGTWQIIFSQTT